MYKRQDWGYEDFSLANTDVTTAREYINYLIEFCLRNDVPCLDRLFNRTDDIDAYLYACLFYGKCAVCGRKAEVHHWDAVGMGRDRTQILHEGMRAISDVYKRQSSAWPAKKSWNRRISRRYFSTVASLRSLSLIHI